MVTRTPMMRAERHVTALLAFVLAPGILGCNAPDKLGRFRQVQIDRILSPMMTVTREAPTMAEVAKAVGLPDLWGELSFDGRVFCTSVMSQGISPTDRQDIDWAYSLESPGRYLALRFGAGQLMTYGTFWFSAWEKAPGTLRERELWRKLLSSGPSPTMEQVIQALGKPDLWGEVDFGAWGFNTGPMRRHESPTGHPHMDWAYSLGEPGSYFGLRFHDRILTEAARLDLRTIHSH